MRPVGASQGVWVRGTTLGSTVKVRRYQPIRTAYSLCGAKTNPRNWQMRRRRLSRERKRRRLGRGMAQNRSPFRRPINRLRTSTGAIAVVLIPHAVRFYRDLLPHSPRVAVFVSGASSRNGRTASKSSSAHLQRLPNPYLRPSIPTLRIVDTTHRDHRRFDFGRAPFPHRIALS